MTTERQDHAGLVKPEEADVEMADVATAGPESAHPEIAGPRPLPTNGRRFMSAEPYASFTPPVPMADWEIAAYRDRPWERRKK